MALTAGLKTPRNMLAKLHSEHARLKTTVTSGDLMNFAITGYHLIEWIKKNPSTGATGESELKALYGNPDIGVCRDIANESKHFALKNDYQDRVTDKTSALSGYGVGGYGNLAARCLQGSIAFAIDNPAGKKARPPHLTKEAPL